MDELNYESLKEPIGGESVDHSHITRKVMHTLAYLVFGIFDLQVVRDEKGKLDRN